MLMILKKLFLTWLFSDIFRYGSPKKCPTILYGVNLWLKPVSATGASSLSATLYQYTSLPLGYHFAFAKYNEKSNYWSKQWERNVYSKQKRQKTVTAHLKGSRCWILLMFPIGKCKCISTTTVNFFSEGGLFFKKRLRLHYPFFTKSNYKLAYFLLGN